MDTPKIKLDAPVYFKNVRQAGAYLVKETGIDAFNATDSIYKALGSRNKSHSTHGYVVARTEDKQVTLSKILKDEQ